MVACEHADWYLACQVENSLV